jgi:bla regulator protein blaR1
MYAVFDIALKSFVISGFTMVILHLLRHKQAGLRSCIADCGLAALALLPLIAFFAPHWEVVALGQSAIFSGIGNSSTAPALAGFDGNAVINTIYIVVVILLIASLLVAVVRLRGLKMSAAIIGEHLWLDALASAQQRMRFPSGVALLRSTDLLSPISWGLMRPTIMISNTTVASVSHAEAIIAHELAHVRRLDWGRLMIAHLATALCWFNPLVWMLSRNADQLREEAADDIVLAMQIDGHDYAEMLVSMARTEQESKFVLANGVASTEGGLKHRIKRILDDRSQRLPLKFTTVIGIMLIYGAGAGSVGAITIFPTGEQAGEMANIDGAVANSEKQASKAAGAVEGAITEAESSVREAEAARAEAIEKAANVPMGKSKSVRKEWVRD